MKRRNNAKKQAVSLKKMSKKVSVLLAVSTLLTAPAAYAGGMAGQVPQAVHDIIGRANQTFVIDLANAFGQGGAYTVAADSANIVEAKVSGTMLHLQLKQPGKSTITVAGGGNANNQFKVFVLDAGADNRFDIGDAQRFAVNNSGSVASAETASAIIGNIDAVSMPVSHVPSVTRSTYELYSQGGTLSPLLLTDFFENIPLTFSVFPSFANGVQASVSGNSLIFSGSPTAPSSFAVTAKDSNGSTASMVVSVLTNRPPTVTSVTYSVYSPIGQTPLELDLRGRFADGDADPLTYSVQPSSSNGITAYINGSYLRFSGTLSAPTQFVVTASDGKGGSASFTYMLNASSVNHAPVAAMAGIYYIGNLNSGAVVDLTKAFVDPDNDTLTYQVHIDDLLPTSDGRGKNWLKLDHDHPTLLHISSLVDQAPTEELSGTVTVTAADSKGESSAKTIKFVYNSDTPATDVKFIAAGSELTLVDLYKRYHFDQATKFTATSNAPESVAASVYGNDLVLHGANALDGYSPKIDVIGTDLNRNVGIIDSFDVLLAESVIRLDGVGRYSIWPNPFSGEEMIDYILTDNPALNGARMYVDGSLYLDDMPANWTGSATITIYCRDIETGNRTTIYTFPLRITPDDLPQ